MATKPIEKLSKKELVEMVHQLNRDCYFWSDRYRTLLDSANNQNEWDKKHRRRFIGTQHVSVAFDLTPWSWQWKPHKWVYKSDDSFEANFAWLFLRIDILSD